MVRAFAVPALGSQQSQYFLDIVALQNNIYTLNLPPSLQCYQGELQKLLDQVFASRPKSKENLALAQQMALNWCLSKCRKEGISFDM
jgi:hypothetical protein